jgi:hypothetical protein
MSIVIGGAFQAAAKLRMRALRANSLAPQRVQRETLLALLRRAARTEFGRAHGFDRIDGVFAYRERVPVRDYAALRPWLERALEGERDVTWPGRIRYFGMSSGTTAGNKYLPISAQHVKNQQRHGFDPVAAYLGWSGDWGLFDGKAVMLGGSSKLTRHPSGALIGDNTGIMANHMPWYIQRQYRPTPKVREIPEWDAKVRALADESLDCDVRLLAGTPSWFPGLFDALIERAREKGRRVSSVREIWPNLSLMTGGGIDYEPYRALIEARVGRDVPYVNVYNATEGGIMGVQDRPDREGMLLVPDNGVFYELVPLERLGEDNPPRLALWEAELGVVYAVVVTTCSGLWSYLLGDTIRFVERFPHRFVFQGRTAAFLNVTGEHVSQGELERAARRAAAETGVRLRDFCVGADIGAGDDGAGVVGAQHVWLVELDGAQRDLSEFVAIADADLQAGNEDYQVHRGSRMGLRAPRAVCLPPGSFYEWMRERGKLGGQNKIPRVVLDAKARASLEAYAGTLGVRGSGGARGAEVVRVAAQAVPSGAARGAC